MQKKKLEEKFDLKYNTRDKYSIRRYMFNKQSFEEQKEHDFSQNIEHENLEEFPIMKEVVGADRESYENKMEQEFIGKDFNEQNRIFNQHNEENKKKEVDFLNKLVINKDQGDPEYARRYNRGETFLNKNMRILTVSALLRCLMASIEFAPT